MGKDARSTSLAWAMVVAGGLAACASFTAAPSTTDAGAGAADSGVADGAAADADPEPAEASCRALLAKRPALHDKDGIYPIRPPGGPLRAFCDMTRDGGGWTLVGRSASFVPDPKPDFGWSSATSEPGTTSVPYSLNAVAAQLAFEEVLVTSLDGARAFVLHVPADFLSYTNRSTTTGDVRAVAGMCQGAPTMLRYAGATGHTDTFFFRDLSGVDQHKGLHPDGFDLSYGDCAQGGELDKLPGAVLVR